MTITAADLAREFNAITGKSLKPSSYSKAKWADIIENARIEVAAANALANDDDDEIGDEYDYHSFTLVDVARSLGVNPKVARSRYRAVENDGIMTRYNFAGKDEWDRVASIISPKRVKK